MQTTILYPLLLFSTCLFADTIRLKDGSSWNGNVTYDGNQFKIESKQGSPSYPPNQVERIEFNLHLENPPIIVPACHWWNVFLVPAGCGREVWSRMWRLYLYGDQFYDKSVGPRMAYEAAKPPKPKSSGRSSRGASRTGVFGQLEFNDEKAKPVKCFLLSITEKELNLNSGPSVTREKVKVFSLKAAP